MVSTNLCKRHWSPLSVWLEEALMHSMFMIKKKKYTHALNACHEQDFTLLGKDTFYFLKRCFLFLMFCLYSFGFYLRYIPVYRLRKWHLLCDLNQFTWLLWFSSSRSFKWDCSFSNTFSASKIFGFYVTAIVPHISSSVHFRISSKESSVSRAIIKYLVPQHLLCT